MVPVSINKDAAKKRIKLDSFPEFRISSVEIETKGDIYIQSGNQGIPATPEEQINKIIEGMSISHFDSFILDVNKKNSKSKFQSNRTYSEEIYMKK